LALRQWQKNPPQDHENATMLHAEILGNLGRLEDEQHNYAAAIEHLTALKEFSPHKVSLENWIKDLKAKLQKPE
jgi:hypothetical protein